MGESAAASTDNAAEGEILTSKVYVTNLSKETKVDDLVSLFSKQGMLARTPQKDHKGRPQGFPDEWPFAVKIYKPGSDGGDALVEYVDKESARSAIKSLNGHLLLGATINVQIAGGGP